MIVLGASLAALLAIGGLYWDPLYRTVTHLKGSPSETWVYEPFSAARPPALRIAVVGDAGDSGTRLDATAAAIAALSDRSPYGVLLLLGDNVYPGGDPEELRETVFLPFADVLDDGAELFAVLGNHDVAEGYGDDQLRALGMPGRWWAQRLDGDVLLVGLDSTDPSNPAQLAWLEQTLRSATEAWRIVALHHPPYSAGYQGSNEEARQTFAPLFERYGVQLVLSGHDHDYQRSVSIEGVVYVVSGAASGSRRTGEDAFTAVSFSWHHFVELNIFEDRVVLRAVNQDRRVADEALIRL